MPRTRPEESDCQGEAFRLDQRIQPRRSLDEGRLRGVDLGARGLVFDAVDVATASRFVIFGLIPRTRHAAKSILGDGARADIRFSGRAALHTDKSICDGATASEHRCNLAQLDS